MVEEWADDWTWRHLGRKIKEGAEYVMDSRIGKFEDLFLPYEIQIFEKNDTELMTVDEAKKVPYFVDFGGLGKGKKDTEKENELFEMVTGISSDTKNDFYKLKKQVKVDLI